MYNRWPKINIWSELRPLNVDESIVAIFFRIRSILIDWDYLQLHTKSKLLFAKWICSIVILNNKIKA